MQKYSEFESIFEDSILLMQDLRFFPGILNDLCWIPVGVGPLGIFLLLIRNFITRSLFSCITHRKILLLSWVATNPCAYIVDKKLQKIQI